MPPEFWQAVEQFNQTEFYACHDTLEALWIEATDPLRRFYQGILQIAVACYHLSNQNQRGAMILLGEGMSRLTTYQPTYGDINVRELLIQSSELLAVLQQTSPEKVSDLVQQMDWGRGEGSDRPSQNSQPLVSLPKIRLLTPD
jgi:uncharacterized protein